MVFRLGTIRGSEIRKNRDGDINTRMLNSEISSPQDVQSVELASQCGEDFNPEDDDVVLVIPIGAAYKMGLVIDDQVAPDETLAKGEREIYSKAAGARLAKLRLNKDGEIILNGGTDFAVAFTEMKAQIDGLRTALNAHTHAGVTTGPGTSGAPSTPFTVNIDNAKVEKVKL